MKKSFNKWLLFPIFVEQNTKEMKKQETIKLSNDRSLMSEVEINQKLIRVGDRLFSQGEDIYEVTELFDGGFTAKCDWEENDFFFSELQKGWSILDSTKEKHRVQDRFVYQ